MKILYTMLILLVTTVICHAGLAYDLMSPVVQVQASRGNGSAVAVQKTKTHTILVTNWHVVRADPKVIVKVFYWNDAHTKIVGWYMTEARVRISSQKVDLAILEVPVYFYIPVAKVVDPGDLDILTPVVAVGCGLSEDVQIYRGVVIDQTWDDPYGEQGFQDLIQTDAFIQPGCSGGALWAEVEGLWVVVGITNSGFKGTAMTFSVKASKVLQILRKVLYKSWLRAIIGSCAQTRSYPGLATCT